MPPKSKYRSYRKPKAEKPENKPVVFGPEPPPKAPAVEVASKFVSRATTSEVINATSRPPNVSTEPEAASAGSSEPLPGQARNAPGPLTEDGSERAEAGTKGKVKYGRRKKLPRKKIDDKMGGWDENHVERPLDESDAARYSP